MWIESFLGVAIGVDLQAKSERFLVEWASLPGQEDMAILRSVREQGPPAGQIFIDVGCDHRVDIDFKHITLSAPHPDLQLFTLEMPLPDATSLAEIDIPQSLTPIPCPHRIAPAQHQDQP